MVYTFWCYLFPLSSFFRELFLYIISLKTLSLFLVPQFVPTLPCPFQLIPTLAFIMCIVLLTKKLYSLSKLCVCLFVILHLARPLFILHWVHHMVHPLVCPTLLCPHISSTTHWFLFCILFPCHFVFVFFIKIVCLFICHPHIASFFGSLLNNSSSLVSSPH